MKGEMDSGNWENKKGMIEKGREWIIEEMKE